MLFTKNPDILRCNRLFNELSLFLSKTCTLVDHKTKLLVILIAIIIIWQLIQHEKKILYKNINYDMIAVGHIFRFLSGNGVNTEL